jgi:hypothetical protein
LERRVLVVRLGATVNDIFNMAARPAIDTDL